MIEEVDAALLIQLNRTARDDVLVLRTDLRVRRQIVGAHQRRVEAGKIHRENRVSVVARDGIFHVCALILVLLLARLFDKHGVLDAKAFLRGIVSGPQELRVDLDLLAAIQQVFGNGIRHLRHFHKLWEHCKFLEKIKHQSTVLQAIASDAPTLLRTHGPECLEDLLWR